MAFAPYESFFIRGIFKGGAEACSGFIFIKGVDSMFRRGRNIFIRGICPFFPTAGHASGGHIPTMTPRWTRHWLYFLQCRLCLIKGICWDAGAKLIISIDLNSDQNNLILMQTNPLFTKWRMWVCVTVGENINGAPKCEIIMVLIHFSNIATAILGLSLLVLVKCYRFLFTLHIFWCNFFTSFIHFLSIVSQSPLFVEKRVW